MLAMDVFEQGVSAFGSAAGRFDRVIFANRGTCDVLEQLEHAEVGVAWERARVPAGRNARQFCNRVAEHFAFEAAEIAFAQGSCFGAVRVGECAQHELRRSPVAPGVGRECRIDCQTRVAQTQSEILGAGLADGCEW